jgi:DNA repair protein RadC
MGPQLARTPDPRLPLAAWSDRQLLHGLGIEMAEGLPDAGCWAGAEPEELAALHGLPGETALRLTVAVEIGRRALHAARRLPEPLRGGEDVFRLLHPRLAHLQTENFFALYLDAKGRLLHERSVSCGTLTSSLVHPREVFAPALLHRAATLVVAHNHPSGDPEPSSEDRAATRRLQRAGRLLGIELLDHVVIARAGYASFVERGWL